jgi:hypothetical protein
MDKITNYEIRIDGKFDYVEYGSEQRLPVIVKSMMFDGFVFLITFLHEGGTAMGCTEYPYKLKQRL